MTRRLAMLALLLTFALAGCGDAGDETPAAAVVRHPSDRAYGAVTTLLAGTGVPARHAPLDAEPTPGALDLTFDDFDANGWTDVDAYATRLVEPAAAELAEAFPSSAPRIATNRDAFLAQLVALDAYGRRAAELVPESDRVIETAHPELQAFAEAYGYRYVQRPEPTELDGELLLGEPAPDGTFEATYVGLMDHTITTIARDLGAASLDIHGSTGQLTLGHDHAHD